MTNAEFERHLEQFPRQRTYLLPALLTAQEMLGHVPDWAVEWIAAHLRVTVNDVEGVVTSFPELRRTAPGARVVRVCTGVACWTAGSGRLLAVLESELGIHAGETTPDGRATLETVTCAFACGVAPVIELNGACHGRQTEDLARAMALAAE